MKRIFGVLVSLIVLGLAIYRSMQFLAIASLVATLVIVFENHARQLYQLGVEMIGNARHAKLGQFEISLRDGSPLDASVFLTAPPWVKVALPTLTSSEVGLLVELSMREGGFAVTDALKRQLRNLRNAGLLDHNKETLEESTEVSLTQAGSEIAAWLKENHAEV